MIRLNDREMYSLEILFMRGMSIGVVSAATCDMDLIDLIGSLYALVNALVNASIASRAF